MHRRNKLKLKLELKLYNLRRRLSMPRNSFVWNQIAASCKIPLLSIKAKIIMLIFSIKNKLAAAMLALFCIASGARAATYNVAGVDDMNSAFSDAATPKTITITQDFRNTDQTKQWTPGGGYATTIGASSTGITAGGLRFSSGNAGSILTLNGFTINWVDAPGNGGVAYIPSASTASFNAMTFDGNRATGNGAVAALANDGAVLNIADSKFTNSGGVQNASRGGAVYVSGGTMTATGTNTFQDMKVSDAGGAIGVARGVANIGGSNTFKNNNAVWGGALYVDSVDTASDATINVNANASAILFDGNSATHGGAIHNSNQGMVNLNATSGGTITFTNNKATASGDTNAGGAILLEASNMSMTSDGVGSLINFSGNSAPSMRGGAIYIISNAGAYTTNFTASNGGTLKFENNSDAGWSGQYGSGALGVLGNYLNLTADGGSIVFTGNKTSSSGTLASGALFVDAWRGGATNSNTTLSLKTTTANSSIVFTNNSISGGTPRDIAIYGGNMLVDGAAGYVYLGGGISGTGNGISLTKNGANTLVLNGNNSLYDPLFVQNAGATKFNTSATAFGSGVGNIRFQGGEGQFVLTDASTANVSKAKGIFSATGALAYLASTSNAITAAFANPANAVFSDSTDVIFGADYDMATNVKVAANYILNADSDFSKTNLGRVIFRDATLKLNKTSYANNYGLSNAVLDLRNNANATTTFANLTATNNASVALDALLSASGGIISLAADKLAVTTTTAGSSTIALGNVNISNLSVDNGMNLTYSAAVLSGLSFSAPLATQYVSSPIYKYAFGTSGSNLTMNAIGFSDGNSLDAANKLTGARKFDFAAYGAAAAQTYATAANLSNAGAGSFAVSGRSGVGDIINAGGKSLFNLTDATALTLTDITLTGASGRNINLANAAASLNIGGATTINDGIAGVAGAQITHGSGTWNLAGDSSGFAGTFTQTGGTTNASGNYLGGLSNIVGGILNLNAAISSGTALAIGSGATLNLTGTTDLALAANQIRNRAGAGGSVNKTGSGALNINGDNSGFTGAFTQTAGTTNVDAAGRTFGGTNSINGGVLNVHSDSIYYKANVGASGTWNHYATTSAANNISGAAVGMNGGTANFNDGNYILGTKLSGSGNVNFVNGTLDLDSSDYTGSIAYGLNNSVLKLDTDASFTTLNATNSSLALAVSFTSGNTISTNTLTTANAGQTIGLSSIKLLNDQLYDGLGNGFTYQTLHGLTWATNNQTFALATSAWQYQASV
ncbi:MAG: hypothetical protein LBL46_04175, partial [Rickettsiales bacterium]|nr:hypothetical protein [Rickettsiales bacterium]